MATLQRTTSPTNCSNHFPTVKKPQSKSPRTSKWSVCLNWIYNLKNDETAGFATFARSCLGSNTDQANQHWRRLKWHRTFSQRKADKWQDCRRITGASRRTRLRSQLGGFENAWKSLRGNLKAFWLRYSSVLDWWHYVCFYSKWWPTILLDVSYGAHSSQSGRHVYSLGPTQSVQLYLSTRSNTLRVGSSDSCGRRAQTAWGSHRCWGHWEYRELKRRRSRHCKRWRKWVESYKFVNYCRRARQRWRGRVSWKSATARWGSAWWVDRIYWKQSTRWLNRRDRARQRVKLWKREWKLARSEEKSSGIWRRRARGSLNAELVDTVIQYGSRRKVPQANSSIHKQYRHNLVGAKWG